MATTVVKQVVAEVRGKTDQLDRELAGAEARLGKTKRAIETNAAAAGGLGNQYAGAARQIASATENMARAGNVTGEATKQILFSGSQIAFAFGPAGVAVGALSVFALAAVTAFSKAREEAKKAADEFERTQRLYLQNRDLTGAARDVALRLAGNAGAEDPNDREGLIRLRERLARERAALLASAPDPNVRRTVGQIAERRAAIERLQQLEQEVQKREELYARESQTYEQLARSESERLATTKKLSDEEKAIAAARLQTARDGVEAAKGITAAIADANRALAEYDREVAAFGARFEALVLGELGTAAEQLTAKFNELIGEGTRLEGANSPRVQQLIALRDSAVQAAGAVAAAERTLSDLELSAARGTGPDATVFGRLAEDAARLTAELARLKPGTQAYAAVQAQLLKVERERAKLLDGVGNAGDSGAAARPTADLVREIQQSVDGALQLAQAFGDVDASAVRVLRSVSQIAGNLPALQAALSGGSGLGVVSAALPIAGALATLLNDSPAEQARREALRKNTDAIRQLTEKAGVLGIGLSGGAAQRALADLAKFNLGGPGPGRVGPGLGVDFANLERVAAALGITLDGSASSFKALQDALAGTISKLGEFGTDLASQLQQAQAEIDLFGVTDPAEQLRIRNQAVGGRSPALDRVLQGLDLTTAEGRAQARLRAQELFNVLKAGGDKLSAADLGGLTGDELLQAILSLVDSLNDVDESLGLNTTTATQADQVIASDRTQITVDQASRLLGLAASQLTELRIIRQALTAATTPLALPSPDVFGGARGGTTLVINQTIEINGPVTDGAAIAQQSMDAIVEYVRRALGTDVRVRRQYAGEAVIS